MASPDRQQPLYPKLELELQPQEDDPSESPKSGLPDSGQPSNKATEARLLACQWIDCSMFFQTSDRLYVGPPGPTIL